jgi:hypothetical protein
MITDAVTTENSQGKDEPCPGYTAFVVIQIFVVTYGNIPRIFFALTMRSMATM